MQIDHPLWAGSQLRLQSGFLSADRMKEEVRAYVRSKRRCDDLTKNEESFNAALEDWLQEKVHNT